MRKTVYSSLAVGLAFICGATLASAQDAKIGQEIYLDRCAVCHGDSGSGDGLVAELFDRKPANLTLLASNNGGVYPFDDVYKSIDGRRDVRAHGFSRMPIWGEYFMVEEMSDAASNPRDAMAVTQGRILALVYYLQSIQQ